MEAMNEIQGPTPIGTSRPYRSLTEALRAHRIAQENYEFITAITDAVGISSFIDRGGALNRPALNTHDRQQALNRAALDTQHRQGALFRAALAWIASPEGPK